jgi:hypothetical protein
MIGWDRYGLHKKHARKCYAEHVFLHPVGYVGHVVHFGALFFFLGWDRYGFHKKHVGTYYAELVFLHATGSTGHVVHSGVSGHEMSMHYLSCSGRTSTDSTKSPPGHVTLNMCIFIRRDLCVM